MSGRSALDQTAEGGCPHTVLDEGTEFMKKIWIMLLIGLSQAATATTYYVSSSTGSDSNAGTSSGTAWQTVGKVNGQTFLPGDSVLFRRGDVWNESLDPSSSGASENPIAFDAYGSGAAPNLTGYHAVPAQAWQLVSGNAWKAALPAVYSTINFCLFGSVWGQKVAASSVNLQGQWDFYFANGSLYVFSVGNPATYYNTAIVPMALSNVPVININGKSWLTFQHFLVNWFDQYGVYVQGASDHLTFANMESDSMIPQGTQPLGFYVNESAPGPGDIKIYNAEAHLNYDGFRFDGAATAITLVNDKAYANRDGALVDNTGAVTYSYCHFYASSLAVASSTDVEWTTGTGPTVGAGNVAADTAPAVQVYQRYPAVVSLTLDDAGMTAGADTYYANTVLPVADAAGVPVGAAITVGYPLAQTLVPTFQGWVNAGRDVTSHSISHTYYTNTDALEIQYTGSGSAATLSVANKTLTITVSGTSDSVTYNLAQGQPQGTILGLEQALNATGHFTATENPTCQGPYGTGCSAYTREALLAQDLADVSGQDVKTSVYHMQMDVTRLTTDEITLSRQWMTSNLTGLPATAVYVYPGGYETFAMQGIAAGVPYSGARGALKEDLGVKDTYASGFDVQNITSFGVSPTWLGLAPAALNQKIQALVWKQMVWGVPWGIFWHMGELQGPDVATLIQDFQNSGATIQSNTGLVNWLRGGTLETGTAGNYYYKLPAASADLDFRPTASSPVVDAGQNLGTLYQVDINGVNQSRYGSAWEIGAHVYAGYSIYGSGGGAHFSIGPPINVIPAAFFGLHFKSGTPWPQIPFGSLRLWDSATRWQQTEASNDVYNFSTLDTYLSLAKGHGLNEMLLTVSGTPQWASSDPTNTECDYASTAPGSCAAPLLLNADGSGTNQYWRDYIYELVSHVVGLNPATYATVNDFGMWNEFTRDTESWTGTNVQMVRLVQDAKCVLTGRGMITATGEACTAANMSVAAVGLAAGATLITTPDSVLTAPEKNSYQAYLQTPGAVDAANVIAVHGYVQTGTCCAAAETLVARMTGLRALMPSSATGLPIWSTEGSWGQSTPNLPDPDLQAAFVARYYLVGWAQGFSRLYWYAYDSPSWGTLWNANGTNGCNDGGSGLGCLTKAGTAYGQVYSWMAGNRMTTPCASVGTVWSCGLTKANGTQVLAVWDTQRSCSGGSCTYSSYGVDPRYTSYLDLSGPTAHAITGGTVQIGAKPILLQ